MLLSSPCPALGLEKFIYIYETVNGAALSLSLRFYYINYYLFKKKENENIIQLFQVYFLPVSGNINNYRNINIIIIILLFGMLFIYSFLFPSRYALSLWICY